MKIIKIEDTSYEVLFTFPVMYCGWESDEIGYVIKDVVKGTLDIALTSHGGFYIARIEELFEKIYEYMGAIQATEKALELVKCNNGKS